MKLSLFYLTASEEEEETMIEAADCIEQQYTTSLHRTL